MRKVASLDFYRYADGESSSSVDASKDQFDHISRASERLVVDRFHSHFIPAPKTVSPATEAVPIS
jgi:hypothetical protein